MNETPTRHQLLAALRVAVTIPVDMTPLDNVRAGYRLLPSEGIFSVRDLEIGEELLVKAGVAKRASDNVCIPRKPAFLAAPRDDAIEALLIAYLSNENPAWLGVATGSGDIRSELIPTQAADALRSIILDPRRREAALLAAGRKHDDEHQRALGEEGELAVIEAWRDEHRRSAVPERALEVVRVSEISDALGYDLSGPDLTGKPLHIEVKTVGASRFHLPIFLTRNEADVGSVDERWRLVFCRRTHDGEISILGWCRAGDISGRLPSDPDDGGTWVVARIVMQREELKPGNPWAEIR